MSIGLTQQIEARQNRSEFVLLSKTEVAKRLSCSKRQIDVLSRRYRDNVKASGNHLPSSPKHGLYRIELSARMHRWNSRDVEEFLNNEQAERAGLELKSWRKSHE